MAPLPIPVELLPHVARFLPLHGKLDFADALGAVCPDLRKIKEKRRLRHAVRDLVIGGDVGEVSRLCARTAPESFRIIRPQLLRAAADARDADMILLLCLHFGGRMDKDLSIVFPKSLPKFSVAPTFQEPRWRRFALRLLPWEDMQASWIEGDIRALMCSFDYHGWPAGPIREWDVQGFGLSEIQTSLLDKWWSDHETRGAERRRSMYHGGGSSGGLLQLVSFGAQDVYITGSPQITFFEALRPSRAS